MKTKTIALYLYFTACLIALASLILGNEHLLLFSKPMIIPAVYFYYITKTRHTDFWFTLIMVFSFMGDAVILLGTRNPLLVMTPYYLSYMVMIGYLVYDIAHVPFKMGNLSLSVLVLAGHALMLYMVLDLQSSQGQRFQVPYVIYGVTLSLMVTLSVYNYLANKTDAPFFMLLACGCSLLSDVFYMVYNEHYHLPLLTYINSAMQFSTYFFLVKYILKRKAYKRLNQMQRVHG